jgi:Flp pilus assembly pilin Flp
VHCRSEVWFPRALDLVGCVLKRLWQEQEGQDLVEYGLLLVFLALVAVVSIKRLTSSVSTVFGSAATSLTSTS